MLLAAGREVVSKTSAYNITKLSYRVEVRVLCERQKLEKQHMPFRRVILYYIIDIFQLICTVCGYSKFCINFRFHICHLNPEIKVPII